MNIKKKLWLMVYYMIAYNLPNYQFPMGRLFNKFRIIVLRRILPLGDNCRIMRRVYIGNGDNISIGKNCRINENVRLDNVRIGNHVLIARDCVILGKMHEFSQTDIPVELQKGHKDYTTIIEDDVWFGLRVVIMPGLIIRTGTIIGAGAILTKDTEAFGIYGGVPAKLIKKRLNSNS